MIRGAVVARQTGRRAIQGEPGVAASRGWVQEGVCGQSERCLRVEHLGLLKGRSAPQDAALVVRRAARR